MGAYTNERTVEFSMTICVSHRTCVHTGNRQHSTQRDHMPSHHKYRDDWTLDKISARTGRVGVNGAPVASGQIIDLFESGIVPQLARIPETSFSFTVLYEHELTNGDSLNTNITYRGYDDQNLTTSSAPDVEEGYELIDATLTYDSDNWSLALVGRNLTDEEYRTHSLPAVRFQGWGDPQTWMVELRNSW